MPRLRDWLASPRRRRRLAGAALATLPLILFAVAALVWPSPKRLPERFDEGPAQVYRAPPPARLTAADRRQISELLNRFVPAAVERRDPAAARLLVTPALRAGTSAADWRRGDLPVYQYPARGSDFSQAWTVKQSWRDDVLADLLLHPDERHRTADSLTFALELKRVGEHWLVDAFYPEASYPSSAGAQAGRHEVGPLDFTAQGASAPAPAKSRISQAWLLAPLVILALVLLLPLALLLRGKRHERQANLALGPRSRELPPLPRRR